MGTVCEKHSAVGRKKQETQTQTQSRAAFSKYKLQIDWKFHFANRSPPVAHSSHFENAGGSGVYVCIPLYSSHVWTPLARYSHAAHNLRRCRNKAKNKFSALSNGAEAVHFSKLAEYLRIRIPSMFLAIGSSVVLHIVQRRVKQVAAHACHICTLACATCFATRTSY